LSVQVEGDQIYQAAEVVILEKPSEISPSILAQLLWAFAALFSANLYQVSQAAFQNIVTELIQHPFNMISEQNLLDIVWGFGTIIMGPGEAILKKLCEEISQRVHLMKPAKIAGIMSCFFKLRQSNYFTPSPSFLQTVAAASRPKLFEMDPQNMTSLLFHFSKLKYKLDSSFFSSYFEALFGIVDEFSGQQIAEVLLSLGSMRVRLKRQDIRQLTSAAVAHIEEFKPKELAQVLWGIAQLMHNYQDSQKDSDRIPTAVQMKLIGEKVLLSVHEFIPINIANILWSYAKLKFCPDSSIAEALGLALVQKAKAPRFPDMVNSFWAFATLHIDPPVLFRDKLEVVAQFHIQAGQCSPQNISTLLWGWATLGFRWDVYEDKPSTSLLCVFAREAMVQIPVFKPRELINTVWAFAMLNYDPGQEFWIQAREFLAVLDIQKDFNSISLNQLFQAHLLSMYRPSWPEKLFDDPELGDLMNACRASWQKQNDEVCVSHLQKNVAEALKTIVGSSQCALEWLSDDGLFSVDTRIDYQGVQVLVEVDGPHHFTKNTQRRLGKTYARNFMLRMHNHLVICLPYHDFEDLKNSTVDLAVYLKKHLDEAVLAFKKHNTHNN